VSLKAARSKRDELAKAVHEGVSPAKQKQLAWIMRTGPKTLVFELQRKLNLTGVAIRSIDLAKA
jgi:hypothetical protein